MQFAVTPSNYSLLLTPQFCARVAVFINFIYSLFAAATVHGE
jgi:hypothetical protein